ncbi:MAG: Hpt domain-containing protein [Chromatiales bacterium]|nr:Hpt domain-containing protein [Chromatiales bacterium]
MQELNLRRRLQWVKGELDRSLAEARQALEDHAEGSGDGAQLAFCITRLRDVRGTLEILEVFGAAMLAEEMQQLALALKEDRVPNEERAQEVLMVALLRLPDYLEKIEQGQPDLPVVLLPLFNDLRAARDAAMLTEAAFFTPDLAGLADALGSAEDSELGETLRGSRHRFHLALLGWFRQRDVARQLGQIKTLAGQWRAAGVSAAAGAVYEAATEIAGALAAGALVDSVAVRLLFGRLDRDNKKIIDRGETGWLDHGRDEGLLKNLLFYVAQIKSPSASVAAIRQRFALDRALPSAAEIASVRDRMLRPDTASMRSVITAIREDLSRVKDRLDLFIRSANRNPADLTGIAPIIGKVGDTLGMVGQGALRVRLQRQVERLARAGDPDGGLSDDQLFEVAKELLGVEAALDDMLALPDEDEAEDVGAGVSAAELAHTRRRLLEETAVEFAHIKDAISQFGADPANIEPLAGVAQRLRLVDGAIGFIELDAAQELVRGIEEVVAASDRRPDVYGGANALIALADLVAGLEYHLDEIAAGIDDDRQPITMARRALERLRELAPEDLGDEPASAVESFEITAEPALAPVVPAPPKATLEEIDDEILGIFLEEAREELETIREHYPRWRDDPADREALLTFRRSFHTLKGSGRMVGAATIGEFAWSIENLLNRVIDQTIEPTDDLYALLDETIRVLPDLVDCQEHGTETTVDVAALAARAERLSHPPAGGGDLPPPPSSPPAPEDSGGGDALEPDAGDDLTLDTAWQLENLELDDTPSGAVVGELGSDDLDGDAGFEPFDFDAQPTDHRGVEDEPAPDDGLSELAEADASGAQADDAAPDLGLEFVSDFSRTSDDEVSGEFDLSDLATDDDDLDGLIDPDESMQSSDVVAGDESVVVESDHALEPLIDDEDATVVDQGLAEPAFGGEPVSVQDSFAVDDSLAAADTPVSAEPPAPDGFADLDAGIAADTLVDDQDPTLVDQGMAAPAFGSEPVSVQDSFDAADRLGADDALESAALPPVGVADINDLEPIDASDLPDLVSAPPVENVAAQPETETFGDAPQPLHGGESTQAEHESAETPADHLQAEDFSAAAWDQPAPDQTTAPATNEFDASEPARDEPSDGFGRDPVLVQTFRDETVDRVQALRGISAVLHDDLQHGDSITRLRFNAHTLSGSAHLAEAAEVASVAHAMDRWAEAYDHARAHADPTDALLIAGAADWIERALNAWVDQQPVESPDSLVERFSTRAQELREFPKMERGFAAAHSGLHDAPAPADVDTSEVVLTPPDWDPEVVEIFLDEGRELCDELDRLLQEWPDEPDPYRLVPDIQRNLHTLKGSARLAGVTAMGDLAHSVESIFTAIANGRVDPDEVVLDGARAAVDRLSENLDRLRAGAVPQPDPHLLADLEFIRTGRPVGSSGEAPEESAASGLDADLTYVDASAAIDEPAELAAAESEFADDFTATEEPPDDRVAYRDDASIDTAEGTDEAADPALVERLFSTGTAKPVQRTRAGGVHGEHIRVRADVVDGLVNSAGEISIYRARMEEKVGSARYTLGELEQTIARLNEQLRKLYIETEAQILFRYEQESETDNEDFDPLELDRFSTMQQLSRALLESVGDLTSLRELLDDVTRQSESLLRQQSRVSTDLQDSLLRTRMVPLASLVPRFNRLVRQTANGLEKSVQLNLSGSGEMDRNVLDRMVAPFEHLLRNAVAHGIESPDDRAAVGKPRTGRIDISMMRDGPDVVIEVADDGAGINLGAVREKALAEGRLGEEVEIGDHDLMQFILESGFSTAAQVSQVAGRGVGLDVVHSEIKQLGGSLEIDSDPGKGARFTIRLPFTLAIAQALLVQVDDELYAAPNTAVEGVVRISRDDLRRMYAGDMGGYTYAGREYATWYLGRLLGYQSGPVLPATRKWYPMLLVRAGETRLALQVDQLLGSTEVVVKSVGPQLSTVPWVSGGTILPDGRVALILDIGALLRMSQRIAAETAPARAAAEVESLAQTIVVEEEAPVVQAPLVMVVDDSITVRKVTGRLLERHGLRVATATDGVDAFDQLQHSVPDLILLDIEMPRMDGYELATHVRADQRLKDVPIIMITSRTGEKHRQRAMEIGVNDYLGKPYQESDLVASMAQFVRMDETV